MKKTGFHPLKKIFEVCDITYSMIDYIGEKQFNKEKEKSNVSPTIIPMNNPVQQSSNSQEKMLMQQQQLLMQQYQQQLQMQQRSQEPKQQGYPMMNPNDKEHMQMIQNMM